MNILLCKIQTTSMVQMMAFLFFIACNGGPMPGANKENSAETMDTKNNINISPFMILKADKAQSVRIKLIYDLREARSFEEVADPYGRVSEKIYTLLNSQKIRISYTWDGGTNRCIGAKAIINNKILAEAKSIGIIKDKQGGYVLDVEEIQFDNNGKTVYRARIKFALSFSADKLAEWPEAGSKIYELFLEWGTISPTGSPFPR